MAISDKLTYLNTTKTLIREGLNNLGASLTSNDTFRSYVNVLNDLYDYLPKVTGSGANVTLNDTKKGLMKITLDPSELLQSSTPSPSSPQDIHTISGNNTIRVCGKNIWNTTLTYGRAWNNSNGTGDVWSNQYARSNDFIKVKPSTTYTISFVSKDNSKNGNILSYTSSQTFIESITLDTHLTFTTSATTEYVKFNFFNGNNYTSGDIYNIQLELGNTATTYETYNGTDYSVNLGNIEYSQISTYKDRTFKNIVGDTDYSSERTDGAWYIKKNIGKVLLDGTEEITRDGTNTTGEYRFIISGPADMKTTTSLSVNGYLISNKFVEISNGDSRSGVDGILIRANNTTAFIIYYDATKEYTKEQFTTWLTNNNVLVYYVLATPTYTQITGTLAEQLEAIYNAMSKDGQTNISQVNNDLPFELDVSALQDLSTL